MELKKNLTLVCAGADAVAASAYGLPLLHLCMGVGPGGGIRRLRLPAQTQRTISRGQRLRYRGEHPQILRRSVGV